MKRLAVRTRYRGWGLGRQLVAALVSWARSAGYVELGLRTGLHEHARRIYTESGFITWDRDERDWYMSQRLQPLTTPV